MTWQPYLEGDLPKLESEVIPQFPCLHRNKMGQIFKKIQASRCIAKTHWWTEEITWVWGAPYFEVKIAEKWCADCGKPLSQKEISREKVIR